MRPIDVRRAMMILVVLSAAGPSASAVGAGPVPVDGTTIAAATALPLPAPLAQLAWVPGRAGDQLIDDFESSTWPEPSIWAAVLDLGRLTGEAITWGARDCRAAAGQQSLWAIGGGAAGAGQPCGSSFRGDQASSAVLALDLRALHSVAQLWLSFDIWADAAANEGLLISVLEGDAQGNPTGRRIVYSATGRSTAWARGVRLDLTRLVDRSGGWRFDARGQQVLLEFLFLGLAGSPGGEGIFLDNLWLSSREATPIVVTPTPGPDLTNGCSGGSQCGSLTVRAYVDSRCDGRFQPGIDGYLREQPRVTVTTGSLVLGTQLSAYGAAYFRLPYDQTVITELSMPPGYELCPNARNPAVREPRDFRLFGRAKVEFNLKRVH